MSLDIQYPYLPKGRCFKYVDLDNKFMAAAKANLPKAGCCKLPVSAVLVKDNQIIGNGANGFAKGHQPNQICKRVELKCPTGTGYHHCPDCVPAGHAERMTILDALSHNHDVAGADLYMYGHWWACKDCWDFIIQHDINDVYLLINSHKLFK